MVSSLQSNTTTTLTILPFHVSLNDIHLLELSILLVAIICIHFRAHLGRQSSGIPTACTYGYTASNLSPCARSARSLPPHRTTYIQLLMISNTALIAHVIVNLSTTLAAILSVCTWCRRVSHLAMPRRAFHHFWRAGAECRCHRPVSSLLGPMADTPGCTRPSTGTPSRIPLGCPTLLIHNLG